MLTSATETQALKIHLNNTSLMVIYVMCNTNITLIRLVMKYSLEQNQNSGHQSYTTKLEHGNSSTSKANESHFYDKQYWTLTKGG